MSRRFGRRRPSRPPALSIGLTLTAAAAGGASAAAVLSPSIPPGGALLIALTLLAGSLIAIRHLLSVARRREREGALRRTSEERDREREELAGVLHDEISPRLVALGYQLDRARRGPGRDADAALLAAHDAIRAAQRQVRGMIGRLLGQPGASRGTDPVIEGIVDEVGDEVEIVRSLDPRITEGPAAELLFGVAREALRNAVRHGRAERVDIVLRRKDAGAVLIVSDDGRGFDPGAVAGRRGHYGLRLLRRRIESAGGFFSLVSAPGHGTVLTCEVPLVEEADESLDEAEPGVSRGGGR